MTWPSTGTTNGPKSVPLSQTYTSLGVPPLHTKIVSLLSVPVTSRSLPDIDTGGRSSGGTFAMTSAAMTAPK